MLPTCPACKQSVLDDDAENCPFCGANMKTGKGGGQAAAPKSPTKASAKERPSATTAPAAPVPATKTATSKSTGAKPVAAKSQAADDDDPFGVDAAANSRAIPLSPRPMKGKTVRFVCPMCETPGFAGSEVAGKEVKCCNENCALPIFTAPKGDGAAAGLDPRTPAMPMPTVSVPTAKKASPALLATAVGTLVLAGGSLWYFVFNEPAAIKPAPAPPSAGNQPTVVPIQTAVTPKAEEKKPAEQARPRAETLRAAILPVMVDLARVTEKNRSKHLCRRLTAEAYVEAGDLKAAKENIDQLLTLKPPLHFHQLPPLTEIAWREVAGGRDVEAKAAVENARKAAADLPAVGRLTFDSVTDLAALLFVTGKTDEAKSLMKKENLLPSGSSGNLAALDRRARLVHSFDLDESASVLPLISWKSPQWVASTLSLVLHGHAGKGVEWLNLAPDAETKADCWAAWGAAVVVAPNAGTAGQDDAVAAAVREASPATQARVWARVAVGRFIAKQKEAAEKAAANAAAAMKSVAVPQDFVLPEMKEILKLDLPDATPAKLNAIAAAEVARAQTQLGQTKAATESLAASLQHLRGQAPSPVAAGRFFEATSRDVSNVKAQLKKALDLKTEDKVQQALTTYRARCRMAFDAANARFALQTDILKAAVDWPLVDAVWAEAAARSSEGTPEEGREEFLKTNLSVRLGHRLRTAGKIEQARKCENAVTTEELSDPRDALQRETAEAAEKGDVGTVAQRLSNYEAKPAEGERFASEDTDWPLLWGLRLACRLADSGKIDKAFDLVGGFKDMLWREAGYEVLAALIAKDSDAAERIWKKYRSSPLTPTEKVSICRGLCAGLSASLEAKK